MPLAEGSNDVRVLLLSDSDVFAGTEKHILDLAVALSSRGESVVLGCPSASALEARGLAAGLEIQRIEKGWLVDLPAITKLRRLLRTGAIDVIHVHNGRTVLQA